MPRHFLIAVFVLFIFGLQAQSTFHRGYPIRQTSPGNDPDTSSFNISAIQLKDKSYLSLDGILPVEDSVFHYLLLTNYDEKGDINWSKEIKLQNTSLKIAIGIGSLFQASNDSIYFSFALLDNENFKVIGAVNNAGEGLWLKILKSVNDEILGSESNLLVEGKDTLIYNATNIDTDDESNFILSKLNSDGSVQQTQQINNFDNDGINMSVTPFDIFSSSDTSLIISGSISNDLISPRAYLLQLDKDLNADLSVSFFTDEIDRISILGGTDVEKKNNNYYVVGQYWSIDPFDILNSYLGSFILKADINGKVIWSKIIEPAFGILNNINGLNLNNDGNIYVSGNVINGQSINPFIVSLKDDGTQNWFNIYERAESNFTILGSLFSTEDKGLALFHSDIEDEQSVVLKTGFLKTDLEGKTTCETKSTLTLFVNQEILSDTIITEIDIINSQYNSIAGFSNNVDKFDIPILTLEDKNDFCPNEPINFLFDANVPGAIAYKWNDDSTLDTLRVFDTGEYSVTVTIDDKYCFMLCDTGKLDRLQVPLATLISGPKVCRNTNFEISSAIQNGKLPFTYAWSGGTSGNDKSKINSNTLGNYSLTVTDACNETSVASIVITESIWFAPPSVGISIGGQVCEGNPIQLFASGTAESGAIISYVWSNSTTGNSTVVPGLGSYSVTVTDNCGLTGMAVLTLDGSVFYKNKPQIAFTDEINDYCQTGNITIFAAASTSNDFFEISEIKWSTGQITTNANTSEIVVTTEGEYKVTVTDECGNTNEDAINIENPSTIIDSCVQFPLLFLPGSRAPDGSTDSMSLEIDNFFGAFSACSMNTDSLTIENLNLQNFEMRVFNRWGKEIFTSTAPLTRWNGRLEDGEQEYYPADVYLWIASYRIGEFCTSSRKGNVTLLR